MNELNNYLDFYMNYENLKSHSNELNKKEEKNLIKHFSREDGAISVGTVINYLIEKRHYETYLYISDNKSIVSMLLYKEYKNKFISKIYYYNLCRIAKKHNLFKVFKRLKKQNSKLSC